MVRQRLDVRASRAASGEIDRMASQCLGELAQAAEPASLGHRVMRGRLALIRRLPPKVVIERALGLVGRRAGAALHRQRDRRHTTYANDSPGGDLFRLIGTVSSDHLHAARGWIAPAAELYGTHHFDPLGSGWLRNTYGMACSGVEGHRYPPGARVEADRDGNWLVGRINPANLVTSRQVWRLIDPDYQPIDWQLDVKSGYRWRERQWSADTPIGHLPGVDVNVPWGLARLQHLAVLAWGYGLAGGGAEGVRPEGWYLAAFRNQILYFIAVPPPRFVINWRCTLDVALRAAYWTAALR